MHHGAVSSGGGALTAKVRGPWFNPGWLLVFHNSLKIFPSLSSCTLKAGREVGGGMA